MFAAAGLGLVLVTVFALPRMRPPSPKRTQQDYLGPNADAVIARSYRSGRNLFRKGDSASLRRAIELFQHALDLEPTYAEAYAGRAASYVALGCGDYLLPADAFPKAKAAALTALQLDSTLLEPHLSLGTYYRYYERDEERARHEFQLAMDRNENLTGAGRSCRPSTPSLRAGAQRPQSPPQGFPP